MRRVGLILQAACGAACLLLVVQFLRLTPRFATGQETRTQKTAAVKTASKTAAPARKAAKTMASKTEPAPKNPLGAFLRRLIPKSPPKLLPSSGRGKFAIPDVDDPREVKRAIRLRDYIDARAPHNRDDVKLLLRTRKAIDAGLYQPALPAVQHLLDRRDDSLIRTEDGKWTSVRERTNLLLAKAPEQFRSLYRLKYGGEARARLDAARKAGDRHAIADVATRYFHTEAGLEAVRYLAATALDRGEYAAAARWFDQVLESGDPLAQDPAFLLQAAYAFRRAGNEPESGRLLKRIESLGGGKALVVGGRSIRPAAWLEKYSRANPSSQELREWWMLFGNASRTATVAGGDPLLLKRWSRPTTHSRPVRRKIERLLETLTDARRSLVPAGNVLTVDGKVIFRTLRGVEVVDAETGSPLWETREGISAERLLTGGTSSTRYFRGGMMITRSMSRGESSNADYQPLTGLLFRNGTHGLLSSDGRQLFVIEDQALLPQVSPNIRFGSADPERGDRYRRSWTTNKLTAYDLQTGRPHWEVGGPARNEAFNLPLAGNYFLGVPVVAGNDLFVVGEADSRIRLHLLDRRTGTVKWSRLIAYSDTKISVDSVRRWFPAQVAVRDGVVVCPTTVGWLVAVDRSNGAILWAHRYSKPQPEPTRRRSFDGSDNHLTEPKPLNQRWLPSAPVVSGGYVVYTPSEEQALFCLRLRDGKRVWKVPQGDYLYLAGVFGDKVVLVGKKAITAVDLKKGTTAWTQPLPGDDGYPAGMGVAVGRQYHLPLHGGRLWTLDTQTGQVLSKLYLPEGSEPLGNLGMYRGQVFSLSAYALTSYEQRDALAEKIRLRKAKLPDDPWAKLKEAEVALLHRDHPKALGLLEGVKETSLGEKLRPRFRQAKLRSLAAVIRSDFSRHDAELRRLADFVKSPEERFLYRRLSAERHRARKEYERAFELYRDLARIDGTRTFRRPDNRKIQLTTREWVAGELRDLWRDMPPQDRRRIDKRLEAEAARLAGIPVEEQLSFCRLYAFRPAAVGVMNRLVESSRKAGRLARAEQLLLRLRLNDNREVAAAATEHLARLLLSRKLTRDAQHVYHELLRDYPKVALPGGRTAAEVVAELTTSRKIDLAARPVPQSWGAYRMRIEQTGTQYQNNQDQELRLGTNRLPYFQDHSFRIDQNDQRLVVKRAADDALAWLAPLRSRTGTNGGQSVDGESFGHSILVLHRGVLQCLSPLEKRVFWTKPLAGITNNTVMYETVYYSQPDGGRVQSLRSAAALVSMLSRVNRAQQNGGLAFANEVCVGLLERRRLKVLDSLTGRTMWTLRGLPPNSRIVGTTQAVFVLPPGNGEPFALRAVDGKRLKAKAGLEAAKTAVGVYGRNLLSIKVNSRSFLGLTSSDCRWRLIDPLTGRSVWERKYGNGNSFTVLERGEIAVLTRDGSLELIDPVSGEVAEYAGLDRGDRSARQIYVVADRDTLFVAANGSGRHNYYGYGSLTSLSVNGNLYAFDRSSKRLLWKQKVTNHQLVQDEFDNSPVLTFMTRSYTRIGQTGYMTMRLLAIDKRTGKKLVEREAPSNQYYSSMTVNLTDRVVEFRGYNERLRLVATPPPRPVKAAKPQRRKDAG